MSRKKWTAKAEVTDAVLRFREKRKWQIALRRYVLEQKWSAAYAPYFGLDIQRFREWIGLQFERGQTWDNFSDGWQFDHIVPVAYFDFGLDAELRLCWNFTNIRVETPGTPASIDVLGAKTYFQTLYARTGYAICREMLQKIETLEAAQVGHTGKQEHFLTQHLPYLKTIATFSEYEYAQLNEGVPLEVILEGQAFSAQVQGVVPPDRSSGDVS
jgi:hypothetical protein